MKTNSASRNVIFGAAVLGAALVTGVIPAAAQQAPVVVPNAIGPLGTAAQPSDEQLLWDLTRQRGSAEAYRTYLANYPQGPHAPEARAILGQLQAGTAAGATLDAAAPAVTPAPELPPAISAADAARAEVAAATAAATSSVETASASAAEARLGLSLTAKKSIQNRLIALGYDTRGADGVFGSGTRRAIKAWQTSRGYAATGYLNDDQSQELQIGGRPGGGETPATMNAATAEAALALTPTQMRIIQSRLTQLGHDTKGVDGKFGAGTRAAITAWQRETRVAATGYLTRADADAILNAGVLPPGGSVAVDADAAARTEQALSLTREDRMTVQRALVAAGHDTRGVDGQFGSGSRKAIRAWQVARGDAATGYLTRVQFDALRAGSGSTPVVTPMPSTPSTGGATLAEETALDLGVIGRTEMQSRLATLGYDPKGIDGKFGPGARTAIRAWQGDNGLTATGYLNAAQVELLRTQKRK